ncbi:Uncharacterised protein [Myroides odoratimimus]|uniref:Uncharacterized protein n=1 Tax=Myroides odoratimimus CCUG 10230 TaxID=883150 RepID=A0ABN0EBD6_9FLAO|nr:hypothetical protein HMPREF9712_01573 [Myroides odoratimimus CCUG 10230]STZ49153.1 Uncharacterised protein [Myroides odoratimimus]
MVQLKGDVAIEFSTLGNEFQYLYGAVKREQANLIENWQGNFNTYMVQLKAYIYNCACHPTHISIPIWCS